MASYHHPTPHLPSLCKGRYMDGGGAITTKTTGADNEGAFTGPDLWEAMKKKKKRPFVLNKVHWIHDLHIIGRQSVFSLRVVGG